MPAYQLTALKNRPRLALFIVTLIVAAVYAQGFNGFWHGDDVPNLHRVYAQTLQGTLWKDAWHLFAAPVPSAGAFYRPMMMLSMSVNYALFEANYAGWYLFNFAVHLANTLLVCLVIGRLADWCDRDARMAAPLAALFFGLSPLLAEGVYWLSARADGWVTLLTLCGLQLWLGTPQKGAGKRAFALPLFVLVALGFKESAAVIPLQMVLLAMAWPGTVPRANRWAIVAAFAMAALFLAWRTYFFGNAWHVYTPDEGDHTATLVRLWQSAQSLPPWWQAMTSETPLLSTAYLALTFAGMVACAVAMTRRQAIVAGALLCASGGLVLATLLNLGAMSSSGEGGRLAYGPIAWLALALGVAMSAPRSVSGNSQDWRAAGTWIMPIAVAVGCVVLSGQLLHVNRAQASLRALTTSIPVWTAAHPGLTMLLVPDNDGAVVMARNAQGGLTLPPIQAEPQLHRIVPTLLSEVELRRDQFCQGLVSQLEIVRPRVGDEETMKAILLPAKIAWPAHVACWSGRERRIIAVKLPPPDATCVSWLESVRPEIAQCGR